MWVIQTENLSRKFGPVVAVNRLNLAVGRGEIFGLVGPDGAGKTTIMRLLSGILSPTEGEGWILGHTITREAELIKEKVGYMAQRFALYGDLTVLENIHFYADLYDVPQRERAGRIERLLAFSNLSPFQNRLAQHLSGGMKQKLGLVCALVHTPQVLLLDEPTNGVDPVSRQDFWRIISDLLEQGVTIFVSTAYLDEAERCNRVGLIHEGNLLFVGTPEEVKRLMLEEIWEVNCSSRMKARDFLSNLPGVHRAWIYGNKIHMLLKDGVKLAEHLARVLQASGFEVFLMQRVAPSLEDVFISLIQEQREKQSAFPKLS
ncbi:MAG: ATP-binding cassette domain-containing protein [Thermodesulfobacteriota bacterium]